MTKNAFDQALGDAVGTLAFSLLEKDQQMTSYLTLKVFQKSYASKLPVEDQRAIAKNVEIAERVLGLDQERVAEFDNIIADPFDKKGNK